MRDAEFGERIEHRVDDGGEAAGAAGFAAAFGAQRIGFGGHRMVADRHHRNVFGAGQRVVHERTGNRLAAGVVADAFHQCLTDALRDPAMQLPGDQHRIDDGAEVIDAGIAHDLHDPGFGIDLDFRDVAAIGKGRWHGLGGMVDVERRRHAFRHLAFAHPARQLDDVDAAIGAGDGETAIAELDVAFGGFHQMGGRALALLDDQFRGLDDRHSAGGDGARAAGAIAGMHDVAVALLELDAFEGHAELCTEHLRKRCRMPLTIVERAGDQPHRAVSFKHDLAEFDAGRCGDFEIGADRNASELALFAALLLAFGKTLVIGDL